MHENTQPSKIGNFIYRALDTRYVAVRDLINTVLPHPFVLYVCIINFFSVVVVLSVLKLKGPFSTYSEFLFLELKLQSKLK